MTDQIGGRLTIRTETPADVAAINAVERAAFGRPDEAEIVERLRASEAWIAGLSLVAEVDGRIVGHSVTSRAWLEPDNGPHMPVVALGPVAVDPEWQRRGIGAGLVRTGIATARALGEDLIVVLGHPTWYPRFGFNPARSQGIEPPVPWPDEAWMAQALTGIGAGLRGRIRYPDAFEPL